jgi:hypothetical protein
VAGKVYTFRKGMAKAKPKKAGKVTSVRLYAPEKERLDRMLEHAQERNPVINLTWVVRELIGLTDVQLLTEEERTYLRTGEGLDTPQAQAADRLQRHA